MKILVTGATGFIGAQLCKALVDRGHVVMGISRNPPVDSQMSSGMHYATYLMGETLPERVVSFSPEIMVHLAWNGIPDFSDKACAANVAAQIQFLGEAEKLASLKKILVAGSCSEYGGQRGLCQEGDRPPPDSYFSWAKQSLCDYFHLACKQRDIRLLWFRVFYVYGPGQRSAALIPTLLKAFRTGQYPEIRNPHASNDFVFIDDVVDAFVLGVEHEEAAGIVNIGSGRISTVLEALQIVEGLGNRATNYSKNIAAGDENQQTQPAMVADINRANSVLAWKPKTSLSEGIARTAKLTV